MVPCSFENAGYSLTEVFLISVEMKIYSSVDLCCQLNRLSYSHGPAWI